jgi:hypothetical protein
MREARSPVRRAVVLRRLEPNQHLERHYSLMVERDLFGTVRLLAVQIWRAGCSLVLDWGALQGAADPALLEGKPWRSIPLMSTWLGVVALAVLDAAHSDLLVTSLG